MAGDRCGIAPVGNTLGRGCCLWAVAVHAVHAGQCLNPNRGRRAGGVP